MMITKKVLFFLVNLYPIKAVEMAAFFDQFMLYERNRN